MFGRTGVVKTTAHNRISASFKKLQLTSAQRSCSTNHKLAVLNKHKYTGAGDFSQGYLAALVDECAQKRVAGHYGSVMTKLVSEIRKLNIDWLR